MVGFNMPFPESCEECPFCMAMMGGYTCAYDMHEIDINNLYTKELCHMVNLDTPNIKPLLQELIQVRLAEIDHLVAGCQSPFFVSQVMEVQGKLLEIAEILGIKEESE